MIGVFWASKTIRITYPVLIAITALARLIILQDKDSASINLIYQGASILLLALAVFFLTLRYSKKLGMDKKIPVKKLNKMKQLFAIVTYYLFGYLIFWTFLHETNLFPKNLG